ncbi:MAG: ABC transporter ATP-binding protein [Gaiellaceae bacterium]
MSPEPILAVEELSVSFPGSAGARVRVLDGVSFTVGHGETIGLVGESGSGKTVSALSIMGLNDRRASIDGGRILLDGADLLAMEERRKRDYRGKRVGMIFQAPKASLNPLLRAGDQIARVVRLHRELDRPAAKDAALELMQAVGISDAARRYRAYPHQLSGGMAQRIMIAMALAGEPELLVADEPTTGLDVTIQAQIFDLLLELQERLRMSVLLITHDLAVVAETCDRVVVMHAGRVVEQASVEGAFREPKHPYTRRLLGSVLRADRRVPRGARPPGAIGERAYASAGCRYAAACEHTFEPCLEVRPAFLPVGGEAGHRALCHLYDDRFAPETVSPGQRSA